MDILYNRGGYITGIRLGVWRSGKGDHGTGICGQRLGSNDNMNQLHYDYDHSLCQFLSDDGQFFVPKLINH